jgi:hypothetical protein
MERPPGNRSSTYYATTSGKKQFPRGKPLQNGEKVSMIKENHEKGERQREGQGLLEMGLDGLFDGLRHSGVL